MNPESKSTAFDTAKLAAKCLTDQRFVNIVKQKYYKINKNLRKNKRQYRWENTHKMLGQQGVTPIKTGVTQSAGPCLATAIEFEPGICLVVVLLGCKDMDSRWVETQKLGKWATQRISKIKMYSNCAVVNQEILQKIKYL